MRSSLLLWVIAFFITVGSAVYQRVTGPTYPVSGHALFGGQEIPFRLDRSHGGETDATVGLLIRDTTMSGVVEWRRFGTSDAWTTVRMHRSGDSLVAPLPHQPPAAKLVYRVVLSTGTVDGIVPSEEGAILRFKGEVPLPVLLLHIVVMFAAMLISTRAGLEALAHGPSISWMAWWSVILFAVGGMVLGPVVQKYAFDTYWTGWPMGSDLTDNKTAFALLAWIVAALGIRRTRIAPRLVLGAAIITVVVFLIPHSLWGSELPADHPVLYAPSPGQQS